jgi:hypothetical protein
MRHGFQPVPAGSQGAIGRPECRQTRRATCAISAGPLFLKQMSWREPIPDDLMIREFPHRQ